MAEPGEMFREAGFNVPRAPVNRDAFHSLWGTGDAVDVPTATPGKMFRDAGFRTPETRVLDPVEFANTWLRPERGSKPGAESEYPTPEKFAAATPGKRAPSTLRQIHEAIDPAVLLPAAVKNTYADMLEHVASSWQTLKEGVADLKDGKVMPSVTGPGKPGKSTNLRGETTEVPGIPDVAPGGLLKVAGGALGIPASVVTGPVNALVQRPVTAVTGNPDIGDRAAFVANTALGRGGAGKTADAVMPSSRAVNALVEAVGPENVPAVVKRLEANPRLSIMDASDPVRTMTQGLIDPAQPRAQDVIVNAVKARIKSAPAAVNTAYTEAMGPAPNVVTMVEGLKERARKAGSEAIQPALANAKAVNVTPVIEAIDKELKPGITAMMDPGTRLPLSDLQQELVRFKQQLTAGGEQLFDPQRLHRLQSDIGDQAYQLSISGDPKQRMLGRQLRDFNEKLIDQIDVAASGEYRPARAKFKEAKDIHEAFDSGFDTLKNRAGVKGLEDRPEALLDWMNHATPEEVVARRLGTRADIDQKIRGAKNQALAGEVITRIEYNQDKLRILFGQKEADRLIRVMEDARDEAHTNAKLLANSKTAETLAGQRALERQKVGGGNPLHYIAPVAAEVLSTVGGTGLPGAAFAGSVALQAAHRGLQKLKQISDTSRNLEFAKAATAIGPARNVLLERLMQHPSVNK